jgi:adenylate kinase
VCDACGGALIQRHDDDEAIAENRIDVYKEQTSPLEEYYRKAGVLTEFDGMNGVARIFEALCKLLEA